MDKIDLENLIYQRAISEQSVIYSRGGRLLVPKSSKALRALINLYNQLFEVENKAVEKLIHQNEQAFYLETQKQWLSEQRLYPVEDSFHLS